MNRMTTAERRRLLRIIASVTGEADDADGRIQRAARLLLRAAIELRAAHTEAAGHKARCDCVQCRDRQAREAVAGLAWQADGMAEVLGMYGAILDPGLMGLAPTPIVVT